MTKVGVIGCGYWGANYLRLLQDLPGAELTWACDEREARLATFAARYSGLKTAPRLDDVLADPDVQTVIVATPAASHHAVVGACLRAGKHVMVEKPMTTTAADARDLGELARRVGRTLMVGLTFLYNPGVAKMRELVADPSFGTPYYLHCTRTNMGPVRPDVSAVWDLASHDLAICDYVMGAQPEWVQAVASTVLDHKLADIAFITLGYPGNVIANVHVSWVDPNKVREVVAVGSQRRAVFDDLNATERVRIFEKGIRSEAEPGSFGEFRLRVRDGDIVSPRLEAAEPLRAQVEHFLHCVETGEEPRSGAAVGVANVAALEAVDRSLAQQGARVAVG